MKYFLKALSALLIMLGSISLVKGGYFLFEDSNLSLFYVLAAGAMFIVAIISFFISEKDIEKEAEIEVVNLTNQFYLK